MIIDAHCIFFWHIAFFFGTRDPIIRPGRPPGQVSKLWKEQLKKKLVRTFQFELEIVNKSVFL